MSLENKSTLERLDELKKKFDSTFFLENQSSVNGIGFYIFPYDPKDEMAVQHFISQLVSEPSKYYRMTEYNLYRVFLSICSDMKILNAIPDVEKKKGDKKLLQQLSGFANPKRFIQKMDHGPHEKGELILLDGIGEVYPILRLHNLLENMQGEFSDVPVVSFYPGSYDGWHLKLFDTIDDQHHYRSMRLL